MWWRNNGWLFLIGFSFALLCMAGLYFVTKEGPAKAQEAEAKAAVALPELTSAPAQAPRVTAPAHLPTLRMRPDSRLAALAQMATGEEAAFEAAVASAVRPGETAPLGMVNRAQLQAALDAVRPLWKECFGDAAARYPGPQRAVMRFTLEGEGEGGRLAKGVVQEVSVGDPYVEACLTDSMLEVRYEAPSGAEPVQVRYGFDYMPSGPAADVR